MVAIYMIVGILIGITAAMVCIVIYSDIVEDREEQSRQLREEQRRRRAMREKLNAPRDTIERNICEETRKALQRRREG